MIKEWQVRYIFVGIINTLFGYIVGVGIFSLFDKHISIFIIGLLANLISITFSYITNRYLVFESEKEIMQEYLKYCTTYGITAIFGMTMLWILIDKIRINIWLAQAIIIILNMVFMYISNSKYIFDTKKTKK
jgi:putative flippase GtrA